MRRGGRLAGLAAVATASALVTLGVPAVTAAPTPAPYTCAGGDFSTFDFIPIPSGDYASITVTGACDVAPGAVINVEGNIDVAPGAVFDAQSAPSTITVGRNVTAGAGSLLGLGCQPDYSNRTGHPCMVEPDGASDITVDGNVTATGANTVLLNGITVSGNVTATGGGGDIPWSIKNNTISGNLTVSDVTADWFGALFNMISGNVTLTNITATDPEDPTPTIFVVRNHIDKNLTCTGLGPNLSGGFFAQRSNVVGRNANGQCAALAVV
jgi:hypothetical protein